MAGNMPKGMVTDRPIREFFDLEDNAVVSEKQQADGSWLEIVRRRPSAADQPMVEAAIARHRTIRQLPAATPSPSCDNLQVSKTRTQDTSHVHRP